MRGKRLVLRDVARRDVEAALDHYVREAGSDVALGFIEALQSAYRFIADHPSLGTPRHAHELHLPGLRSRTLKGFPFLVFYIERADYIDVWRVLHSRRDIPLSLRDPGR